MAGRGRLARAKRNGTLPGLPESPQHQQWRRARDEALARIEPLRDELSQTLARATALLARELASADEWFELGRELQDQCRGLACATYCVREWVEPEDTRSDRPARRRKLALTGLQVLSVKQPGAR
jgi:hypothetical protein